MTEKYVDKTGTDDKPNPLRDAYQEFPRAMTEIAKVTAYGAKKHAPRGWQTFDPRYGFAYHTSKVGRHLLAEETEGPVNHADGDNLHAAAVAWNALARLENLLKAKEQGRLTEDGTIVDLPVPNHRPGGITFVDRSGPPEKRSFDPFDSH